ncbi:MAG: signal peptidase II [Clostridiales bacterium]|nr:signal peptidase II [Clostridiales bacterium]
MLFILIFALVILILDQLSKLFIVGFFIESGNMLIDGLLTELGESIVLIPKTLSFTYVLNDGAAFGILSNQRLFFLITTIAICVIGFIVLLRFPQKHITLKISASFILGGALGNLIDRSVIGVVRDFIDLKLIDTITGYSFPVFNIADIFVVVGTILLAVYILFIHDKIYPPKEKKDKENG